MGYREDVALVYSMIGWQEFHDKLNSINYSDTDRDAVHQVIDAAGQHLVHKSGDHILIFDQIKSGADDFQLIINIFAGTFDQIEDCFFTFISDEDKLEQIKHFCLISKFAEPVLY